MAPILAFVEMLVSVNFAPETSAPVWYFTEPAMLPVGEAEAAGANTKASAESIIPKILDILAGFMVCLRKILEWPWRPLTAFQALQNLQGPIELKLTSLLGRATW